MTDVGELVVRIRADAAQLEREMRRANGVVRSSAGDMGSSLTALKSQFAALVPALSAVALVNFGRTAIAEADHINDLAMRVGFLGSTLSALDIPLRQSGSSLDEFTSSMVRMNNMIGEAAKGGQEQIKAFDALGLSVGKLEALSPEQQFFSIAAALSQIGSQSEFTNLGIAIFGRSFASLAPLIRESNGELEAFVDKQKELGNALTEDELHRIDQFGDRWTEVFARMKLGVIDFLTYFHQLGEEHRRMLDDMDLPANVSHTPGTTLSNEDAARRLRSDMREKGIKFDAPDAKGSNAGMIRDAKLESARKALQDYNRDLERQNLILRQSPREQAAMEAAFKTMDLAQKAGIKTSQDQIQANMDLARANYDLAESMQEAARFQQELHDKLSATLTDVVFKAGSAEEAMLGFAESIARAAFEKKVAGPLADALIGTGGNSGLLDGFIGSIGSSFGGFFADGGRPPLGVPSIVGERGPEIFVPDTAGTVIPNHKLGGQTVVVQQTIQVNPGVPELINARIREAAPVIAAQAQAATLHAMRHGGDASRIIGARS